MTNLSVILAAFNQWNDASIAYKKAPTLDGWCTLNQLHNSLIPTAISHPITRSEYESMLTGRETHSDDVIYRTEGTWWRGDDTMHWALAHFARRAALENERGKYVAPSDAALGLELVTESLPSGFREYHDQSEQ